MPNRDMVQRGKQPQHVAKLWLFPMLWFFLVLWLETWNAVAFHTVAPTAVAWLWLVWLNCLSYVLLIFTFGTS